MVVELIANGRVESHRNAHRFQLAAQPLAVGIQPLTAHELAAARDDFSPSWHHNLSNIAVGSCRLPLIVVNCFTLAARVDSGIIASWNGIYTLRGTPAGPPKRLLETLSTIAVNRPGPPPLPRAEMDIHGLNRWTVKSLEKSEKRGVHAARNGPSEDRSVGSALERFSFVLRTSWTWAGSTIPRAPKERQFIAWGRQPLSLPSSFSGQMIIFCAFCLGFFAPVVVESSQHSHGDGRDGSHFTRRSAGWIPLFWTPRPGPRRNSPPPTFMTNAAPIDWCTWRPKSQHIRPGVFPNKPNPGTI